MVLSRSSLSVMLLLLSGGPVAPAQFIRVFLTGQARLEVPPLRLSAFPRFTFLGAVCRTHTASTPSGGGGRKPFRLQLPAAEFTSGVFHVVAPFMEGSGDPARCWSDFVAVFDSPAEGALFGFPVVGGSIEHLVVFGVFESEVLGGLAFVYAVGGDFHCFFLLGLSWCGVPYSYYYTQCVQKKQLAEMTKMTAFSCVICTQCV